MSWTHTMHSVTWTNPCCVPVVCVGSLSSSLLISGQHLELYLERLTLQFFCAENFISFCGHRDIRPTRLTHNQCLMWALKNSFMVSMSKIYLNFDRNKAYLGTVLHTLSVCESQQSLLSTVIRKRRCSDTWSIVALRRTRSSGKDDSWCFCLVAIVIDLVLIGLITIMVIVTPAGYLIQTVLHIASDLQNIFFQMCAMLCYLPACHNQHIYFSRRSLIKKTTTKYWKEQTQRQDLTESSEQ